MRRGSWIPLFCLAAATVSLPAFAQPRAGAAASETAAAPQTDEQRKAQEHFQRARDLYQAGKYSEAISELEIARGLDPKAKDLVMNLGIVHERLGKYDDAIAHLKTYLEMDGVTPAERARVEAMIKRIEGAKDAAPSPALAPTAVEPPAEPAEPTTPRAAPTARGRVDALTITAGAIAAVGLGVGAGVGIYALSARPGDGFVTGRDGTYTELQQKANDAHTAAIVADVSLGVGVLASLATAWLYFGRTKEPASAPAAGSRGARLSVTPSPATSGGVVYVGGAF